MASYSFNASVIICSVSSNIKALCFTLTKANISTLLLNTKTSLLFHFVTLSVQNQKYREKPDELWICRSVTLLQPHWSLLSVSLSLSLHPFSSSLPSASLLISVPWMGRVVIRPGQPSPALLPDRCQQGAAALAWVSPTTTAPREWGNQARVIYAGPEHAGQLVSAWSVCILWECTRVFRSPPFLQHPAINLLWHVKLNLWANLLATDMFDLKRERRLEYKM